MSLRKTALQQANGVDLEEKETIAVSARATDCFSCEVVGRQATIALRFASTVLYFINRHD